MAHNKGRQLDRQPHIQSLSIHHQQIQISQFPSGQELQDLERAHPGSADRALALVEKRLDHQMKIEADDAPVRRQIALSSAKKQSLGPFVAFAFGAMGMGFAYKLAMGGHDYVAAVVGGMPMATAIGYFITGRFKGDGQKTSD